MPSQLNSSVVAINDNSWAEILEDWIALQSNNSRAARKVSSRAIKIGDKTVTVSTKISTGNKREVSETDLYLLGMIHKKFCQRSMNAHLFQQSIWLLNNRQQCEYRKKGIWKSSQWEFLGAIEKLVYRVDHVEKRLRRAEELLYYIIAGNGKVKSKLIEY